MERQVKRRRWLTSEEVARVQELFAWGTRPDLTHKLVAAQLGVDPFAVRRALRHGYVEPKVPWVKPWETAERTSDGHAD